MNIYLLIDKVLSGKGSEEEKMRLEEWLKDPRNKEEFEDLKLLWEFSQSSESRRQSDPHFYDGLYKIRELIELRKSSWRRKGWRFYTMIVMLVLLIIVLIYCCISYQNDHQRKDQIIVDGSASLAEVFSLIEKKYSVTIIVEDQSIRKCRFIGTFTSASRLEDVLRVMERTNGLTYSRIGKRQIKLMGSGCP